MSIPFREGCSYVSLLESNVPDSEQSPSRSLARGKNRIVLHADSKSEELVRPTHYDIDRQLSPTSPLFTGAGTRSMAAFVFTDFVEALQKSRREPNSYNAMALCAS